jgi:hypothetical protein
MKMVIMTVMIVALMVVFGCQTSPQDGSMSEGGESKVAAVPVDTNNPAGAPGSESVTSCYPDVTDGNGPTILLSYSEETLKENRICSFMYFIPLISPVSVESETSVNNRQQAGIISYRRQITARAFYVTCEFEMAGEGFSTYIFDPAGAITLRSAEVKPGGTLTNMLDYIRFEGAGFGGIQVRGTVDGSTETVTEVDVEFNARGRESPVTVGLYDIKAKNGQYSYANRSNEIVARVNTLTFKRSEKPRMAISVASIARKAQKAGFLGRFKAVVVNLFIKPVKVDKLGNDTMLDFGYVLLKQESAFTFPKAENLRQARIVPTDHDYARSGVQAAGDEAEEGEPVQLEPAISNRP